MNIYQHAREFAEEIMKTEQAVKYFSLKEEKENNPEQYAKAKSDYDNLLNEIFAIIKYTVGEEDILEQTQNKGCGHICTGCKN